MAGRVAAAAPPTNDRLLIGLSGVMHQSSAAAGWGRALWRLVVDPANAGV
jgi:hypothetical protein